jgi:hypothetical protein
MILPTIREAKVSESSSSEKQPDRVQKYSGQDYLNNYFEGLTPIIYARASAIAQEQGRAEDVQPRDVAQACAEIAPGRPFPPEKEETFWQRIGSSITGITIISAILAVIFGAIGFAGLRWGGPWEPKVYGHSST